MLRDLLISAGPLINQSLSAAIATIAGSFFLYSLVKGLRNRVAQAFSLLLFFVLFTYIGDLGVSFTDDPHVAEAWLRFQWLGIAFAPAVYVHLSHAILTLTGLQSQGRRLWAVRFLYLLALVSLVLVLFSDTLVRDLQMDPAPHFRPGPLFWLFGVYFSGAVILSLWFVIRARNRTLTEATHRRMTYLLIPYLAPAVGVFPFLLISGQGWVSPAGFYGLLIVADAILSVMLTFMAYAMAFIGSLVPDRLVKAQMLQFFLRGPVVAIATLAVVIWLPRASAVLGLPGDEVMPLMVVTEILFLQWAITLARPHLERWLIYTGDQQEVRRIQQLEERLLTGADFHRLLDTILTVICDYLRIESAFVASTNNGGPHLERAIGLPDTLGEKLQQSASLPGQTDPDEPLESVILNGNLYQWEGFWLIPLHFQAESGSAPRLVGLLGVATPVNGGAKLESDRQQVLMALAARTAEVLEDRRIQKEVFASLEGLLPELDTPGRLREPELIDRADLLTALGPGQPAHPDFVDKIKDALGHYWGGPRLTDAVLMNLQVVQQAMEENDGNPQRAMRAVLQQAIESLRPEGQRSMTTAEWILYNILEMRFIQGRKVRDVAMRLAMSESDLYRKQRIAIEAVSGIIMDMEARAAQDSAQEE